MRSPAKLAPIGVEFKSKSIEAERQHAEHGISNLMFSQW
jgi:hypothetical protein